MPMRITEDCVQCAACPDACPRGAIQDLAGAFTIAPARCDDCAGRSPPPCVEVCPTEAIVEVERGRQPDSPAPPESQTHPAALAQPAPPLPPPAEGARKGGHSGLPWGWRLALFGLATAASMIHFFSASARMPAEAPPPSGWLWVAYTAAGILFGVALFLSALFLDDGQVSASNVVGLMCLVFLGGLGMYALRTGSGLGPGLAIFALSWIAAGFALLGSPRGTTR